METIEFFKIITLINLIGLLSLHWRLLKSRPYDIDPDRVDKNFNIMNSAIDIINRTNVEVTARLQEMIDTGFLNIMVVNQRITDIENEMNIKVNTANMLETILNECEKNEGEPFDVRVNVILPQDLYEGKDDERICN